MDYTEIPMYLRCPGHFRVSEDGSKISYVPPSLKKMTIFVPGPIYVEYSDVEDIITPATGIWKNPTPHDAHKPHKGTSHQPHRHGSADFRQSTPGLTIEQIQNSTFIHGTENMPAPINVPPQQRKKLTVPGESSDQVEMSGHVSEARIKMGSDLHL